MRRLPGTLAAALGLHAALVAWVARRPLLPASSPSPAPAPVEIAVDALPATEEAQPATDAPSPANAPRAPSPRHVARAGSPRASKVAPAGTGSGAAVEGASPPQAPAEGPPRAGPPDSTPWLVPRPLSLHMGPGAAAMARDPREPEAKPKDAAQLRGALDAGDTWLGAGAGPVLRAARDVAMRAPIDDSAATLEVDVDAEGKVVAVRVSDSSRARREWDEIARALLAALRGRALPIARGPRGAVLAIGVEAAILLPSGNRPGHTLQPFARAGTAGVEFDVTDLAPRPSKVVKARVLGTRRL